MTAPRFFVSPESLQDDKAIIRGDLVHQIRNVLRLREGDRITLLDDSGWEHETELQTISHDQAIGHILRKTLTKGEPSTKITLYQGILKGKQFDWVLQKGTELGIVAFVPIICSRCIISGIGEIGATKMVRWQRIILEAAEQSRRGNLPKLRSPLLFSQACEQARRGGMSLIPWEEERAVSLRYLLRESEGRDRPFSINIFIGPEGGFTPQEMEEARNYGLIPVTLGPRVLRAETAGLVSATTVLYEMGDLE